MIKLFVFLQLASLVFGHGRLLKPMTRVGHTNYENNPSHVTNAMSWTSNKNWVCRHESPTEPTMVLADSQLDLETTYSAPHVGDCEVYISYDWDQPREDMKWFKVANFPSCGVNRGNQIESFNLPKWLKNGRAVLRWSWYALHVSAGGTVEFFNQCADIVIDNGTEQLPSNLITYGILGLQPESPSQLPGYRNPFPPHEDDTSITGPACAQGMTENNCLLSAPDTLRNIKIEGLDTFDFTTTTKGPNSPTQSPVQDVTQAPVPVDGCESGRFESIQSHISDEYCQSNCLMDNCIPSICQCVIDYVYQPTPSPVRTVNDECETDLSQCQANLFQVEKELTEKTSPLQNYLLVQPSESFVEESWQFDEVKLKVSNAIPEGFTLVLSNQDGFNQYTLKETNSGNLYSTCVFYSQDANEICPENAQCGGTSKNGWPNAVAKRLKEALERNNFRHEYCASVREVCDFWPQYWKETFIPMMDFSTNTIEESDLQRMVENICVSPSNELLYVTKDEIKRTCVGWSPAPKERCENNKRFLCSGFSLGHHTYGHPKQIIQSLGVALNYGENGETDYYHPQCGFLQNLFE